MRDSVGVSLRVREDYPQAQGPIVFLIYRLIPTVIALWLPYFALSESQPRALAGSAILAIAVTMLYRLPRAGDYAMLRRTLEDAQLPDDVVRYFRSEWKVRNAIFMVTVLNLYVAVLMWLVIVQPRAGEVAPLMTIDGVVIALYFVGSCGLHVADITDSEAARRFIFKLLSPTALRALSVSEEVEGE